MMKKLALATVLTAFVCVNAAAQDVKTVLTNASRAMGVDKLTSITYSGTAHDVSFLQSYGVNTPMRPITNYVRAIDLTTPASRHTGATMNAPGGAQTGPPAAGVFNQGVTAQQADLSQPWQNQLELWITPWGFLKGATLANNATMATQTISGATYRAITWKPTVKAASGADYRVVGYVNNRDL